MSGPVHPDAAPHTDLDPAGRSPEPTLGPDEEGEAPLDEGGVTGDDAAWVHGDGRPA